VHHCRIYEISFICCMLVAELETGCGSPGQQILIELFTGKCVRPVVLYVTYLLQFHL